MKNTTKIFKQIKAFLIILTMLITASSCEKFLEEKPKSDLSMVTYFTDPEHAYSAVNRLYRDGPFDLYNEGSAWSGTLNMLYGHLAGFHDNNYKGQESYIISAQELTLTDVDLNEQAMSIWEDLYFEISNANTAIKGIPSTPELTDDEINYQLAQAKFFRAFSYFILVRTFGDVPLITEPYESLDNIIIERTESEKVYDLITEDLEFAVLYLNNTKMSSNESRVTKGAAETILAEVYLTMSGYPLQINKYADAARHAKQVISDGVYSLITNDDLDEGSAYNKMRSESNDASSDEYIYYIEYLEGISNAPYAKWSLPNTFKNTNVGAHENTYEPIEELIDLYDNTNDLRAQERQLFFTSYEGEAFNGYAPWIWFDEHAHETANSSKNFVAYRYTDVLLIAAEAIVKSGGSQSEAAGYLAQVKARASMNKTEEEIITELSALTSTKFIEEVWSERYRECALEYKSWFDLIRTRKYPVGDATGNVEYVDLIGHTNHWGATYQEKHLLWQLPETERQRNPALTQNPY